MFHRPVGGAVEPVSLGVVDAEVQYALIGCVVVLGLLVLVAIDILLPAPLVVAAYLRWLRRS